MSIKEGYGRIIVKIKEETSKDITFGSLGLTFGDEGLTFGTPTDTQQSISFKLQPESNAPEDADYSFKLLKEQSCCNESDYSFVLKHHAGKVSTYLALELTGGCPPFTWTVAGGTLGVWDAANREYVTSLTSSNQGAFIGILDGSTNTDPDGDLVTVTDFCGNSQTAFIKTCFTYTEGIPPGGGGIGDCGALYQEMVIMKSDYYDQYLVTLKVTDVLDDNTILTERTEYTASISSDVRFDNNAITNVWKDINDELILEESGYVPEYNKTKARMSFEDEHGLAVNDVVVVAIDGSYCSCADQRIYKILYGVGPFFIYFTDGINVYFPFGGASEFYDGTYLDDKSKYFWINNNIFTYDAFLLPLCDSATTIVVTDFCEQVVSETWFPSLVAMGLAGGELHIIGNDTVGCSGDYITMLTSDLILDQYCTPNYYLTGGIVGSLEVHYINARNYCVDSDYGHTARQIRYPKSAKWTPPQGSCCPVISETISLWACPPGSLNAVLLDSVTVNSIQDLAGLAWDPAFSPTSVFRPGGGANEYDFKVTGGVGPYTWTVEESSYGNHALATVVNGYVNWENSVTAGVVNILHVGSVGSCGTVKITCTDQCNTISMHVAVTNVGSFVLVYQDNDNARASIIAEFGLTDTVRTKASYPGFQWIETLDQFKAIEELYTYSRSSPPYGMDGTFCDSPRIYVPLGDVGLKWDDEVIQGGWNDYVYRTTYPSFIFSAADSKTEWVPTADWNFYNEYRPCYQISGSNVVSVDVIRSLKFYVWSC